MRELKINSKDEGQRLDKFLLKYLNASQKSFIYKMLRKKNIKLNGKKAEGSEIITAGDIISLFLGEDTINKFMTEKEISVSAGALDIIYEDDDIIAVNKPCGLLSQPGEGIKDSVNSRILNYLHEKGAFDTSKESTFTPGIVNRLDRNTSGIILCGKNLKAAQELNKLIADGGIDKYYFALIHGTLKEKLFLKGYHEKDMPSNKVKIIFDEKSGTKEVLTEVEPLEYNNGISYVKIKLVTGKTHQIRAHLEASGYPVLGDRKYSGGFQDYEIKNQMLHAGEIIFNSSEGELGYLSGTSMKAPAPKEFLRIYNKYFKKA